MLTSNQNNNHVYYKSRHINFQTERYCFKCHKVKHINLFHKVFPYFKISTKCIGCR